MQYGKVNISSKTQLSKQCCQITIYRHKLGAGLAYVNQLLIEDRKVAKNLSVPKINKTKKVSQQKNPKKRPYFQQPQAYLSFPRITLLPSFADS